MSRATHCLIDAGCIDNYRSGHSIRADIQPKTNRIARTINLWQERSRQRRELQALADEPDLLKDTGLSYYDVKREASKPFWRQ